MTYSITTNFGVWKIEPGPNGTSILKRETKLRWTPVGMYQSPEEAALHVGTGKTNEHDWDALSHRVDDFDLSRWDKDETDMASE